MRPAERAFPQRPVEGAKEEERQQIQGPGQVWQPRPVRARGRTGRGREWQPVRPSGSHLFLFPGDGIRPGSSGQRNPISSSPWAQRRGQILILRCLKALRTPKVENQAQDFLLLSLSDFNHMLSLKVWDYLRRDTGIKKEALFGLNFCSRLLRTHVAGYSFAPF